MRTDICRYDRILAGLDRAGRSRCAARDFRAVGLIVTVLTAFETYPA